MTVDEFLSNILEQEKICKYCNKPIETHVSNDMFCSKICKQVYFS